MPWKAKNSRAPRRRPRSGRGSGDTRRHHAAHTDRHATTATRRQRRQLCARDSELDSLRELGPGAPRRRHDIQRIHTLKDYMPLTTGDRQERWLPSCAVAHQARNKEAARLVKLLMSWCWCTGREFALWAATRVRRRAVGFGRWGRTAASSLQVGVTATRSRVMCWRRPRRHCARRGVAAARPLRPGRCAWLHRRAAPSISSRRSLIAPTRAAEAAGRLGPEDAQGYLTGARRRFRGRAVPGRRVSDLVGDLQRDRAGRIKACAAFTSQRVLPASHAR
jgi:hypothetical protein